MVVESGSADSDAGDARRDALQLRRWRHRQAICAESAKGAAHRLKGIGEAYRHDMEEDAAVVLSHTDRCSATAAVTLLISNAGIISTAVCANVHLACYN